MSVWVFLAYLLIFFTLLLAVVGGVQVLRRLEAQRRLRQELLKMQAELGPDARDDDETGDR